MTPVDVLVAGMGFAGSTSARVLAEAGCRVHLVDRRPHIGGNAYDTFDAHGVQVAPLHYPHLSHDEIFHSVEDFYKRFYFRSGKIASIVGEMVRSPDMMKRRLREGVEFFHFLRERKMAG